jgi:hypothetical protein
MTLDGKTFRVTATAAGGVVSSDTRLHLKQRGPRVLGRYCGGTIARGYLIGGLSGSGLSFRYAQTEADGHVHGGRSLCDLHQLPDGRLLISEHFTWETRAGSGTNLFEEIAS